MNRIVADTNI